MLIWTRVLALPEEEAGNGTASGSSNLILRELKSSGLVARTTHWTEKGLIFILGLRALKAGWIPGDGVNVDRQIALRCLPCLHF